MIRYDEVPGYAHTTSSTFNVRWDPWSAMEDWAEQGIDPADKLVIADATGIKGRSRPLCEYPKWAVGWGWLERPSRGPQPPASNPVEALFASLRHTAEGLGEWAFYAVVAPIAVALIQRIQIGRAHVSTPVTNAKI